MFLELHNGSVDCSNSLNTQFPPIAHADIGNRIVVIQTETAGEQSFFVPFTIVLGQDARQCYDCLLKGMKCISNPTPDVEISTMLMEPRGWEDAPRVQLAVIVSIDRL